MKDKIKIIGLCGTSGAGKGYISSFLENKGIKVIDTDRLYREVTVKKGSECLLELTQYFGTDIVSADGTLDRRVLSATVFGDNTGEKLKMLNSITHKHIRTDTERIIADCIEKGIKAVVIDAPVLFESGFDSMCHSVICVTAPYELKLKRIMERDNITEDAARARLDKQLCDSELRARCDFEIINDNKANVTEQINSVLDRLQI